MAPVQYQLIAFSSLFYYELVQLRQDVLRTPLGQQLEFDQVRTDHLDWHLGAYTSAQLIGAVSLTPDGSDSIRMRQMAVKPDYQALGIGSELVRQAEKVAYTKGYTTLILDARETALSFYKRLGYNTTSDPFLKSHIPHLTMQKRLVHV